MSFQIVQDITSFQIVQNMIIMSFTSPSFVSFS